MVHTMQVIHIERITVMNACSHFIVGLTAETIEKGFTTVLAPARGGTYSSK